MSDQKIRIVDVSADGMLAVVEGLPLSDLGLDGAIVIDAETGEELGLFEGFVALPGKSLRESIEAALGPGRDLKLPATSEEPKA